MWYYAMRCFYKISYMLKSLYTIWLLGRVYLALNNKLRTELVKNAGDLLRLQIR